MKTKRNFFKKVLSIALVPILMCGAYFARSSHASETEKNDKKSDLKATLTELAPSTENDHETPVLEEDAKSDAPLLADENKNEDDLTTAVPNEKDEEKTGEFVNTHSVPYEINQVGVDDNHLATNDTTQEEITNDAILSEAMKNVNGEETNLTDAKNNFENKNALEQNTVVIVDSITGQKESFDRRDPNSVIYAMRALSNSARSEDVSKGNDSSQGDGKTSGNERKNTSGTNEKHETLAAKKNASLPTLQ